jgi:hypothetical protein
MIIPISRRNPPATRICSAASPIIILIGNFFFGVEYIVDQDCQVVRNIRRWSKISIVSLLLSRLLLKYQGTGKIHAFIQEFKLLAQRVDLDGWLGVVEFGEKPTRWAGKDWRHNAGWVWKEQTST